MSYYYHFRPTLFIGKHSGGLYALPSLVDEATVSIDVRVFFSHVNLGIIFRFLLILYREILVHNQE